MKDLPPDPPIYTAPPERWFDRHCHTRGDVSVVGVTKTLGAMWAMLNDYLGIEKCNDRTTRQAGMQELFLTFLKRCGTRNVMDVWRGLCNNIQDKSEEPEKLYRELLSQRHLK